MTGLVKKAQKFWIFWLGLFVLQLFLRISSFYTPILDVDETQFAGFAHVLMDGGLPFRHSLDTKPLGIYWFYQICFELFGRFNMEAVHFVTALLGFGVAIFLYQTLKNFGWRREGCFAAFLYVIFSSMFIPKFLSTSINAVMVFFLILSAYLLSAAFTSSRDSRFKKICFYSSAFILGVALLFKYTAAIQFFMVPILFMSSSFNRGKTLKEKIKIWTEGSFLYGFVFCVPFIFHSLYLYKIGVWSDFMQWSLFGSGSYIGQGGSTIRYGQSFLIRFCSFVLIGSLLWWQAGKAILYNAVFKKPVLFFSIWFFLSLIPAFVGGRFYSHYFIPFIPPLCSLAGLGWFLTRAGKKRPHGYEWVSVRRKVFLFGALVPALFFWMMRFDHHFYLSLFPDDQIYEQQEIGESLKTMKGENDSLYVWGFATGIYFHSGLKSSSRFLWSDLLTGRTPGPSYARKNLEEQNQFENPNAWAVFLEDMKTSQPEFFVDTSPAKIHGYDKFPIQNYPQLTSYLKENYVESYRVKGAVVYKKKHNSSEKQDEL